MESGQDLPIVGVCIVSDPTKLPPNYTLIDKTHDKYEDADMWKDGLFGRRVMRYLCVQRKIPCSTDDVLVDVTLINERDDPPPGFMVLESTQDSAEKATKKRQLCLRWMVPSMTSDAITELVFINRTLKRAPVSYTMIGDINNLALCYKMGRIPAPSSSDQGGQTGGGGGGGSHGLPYSTATGLPYAPRMAGLSSTPGLGINTTAASKGHHPGPVSPPVQTNPLSGVQWKMNPRYGLIMELQKLTIPNIQGKTRSDLERQYAYSFELEQSVSKAALVS